MIKIAFVAILLVVALSGVLAQGVLGVDTSNPVPADAAACLARNNFTWAIVRDVMIYNIYLLSIERYLVVLTVSVRLFSSGSISPMQCIPASCLHPPLSLTLMSQRIRLYAVIGPISLGIPIKVIYFWG